MKVSRPFNIWEIGKVVSSFVFSHLFSPEWPKGNLNGSLFGQEKSVFFVIIKSINLWTNFPEKIAPLPDHLKLNGFF